MRRTLCTLALSIALIVSTTTITIAGGQEDILRFVPADARAAIEARIHDAGVRRLSEEQVAHAAALRKELGLSSDEGVVRKLAEDPRSSGGIAIEGDEFARSTVTRSEAKELLARATLQAHGPSVVSAAVAEFDDAFAGTAFVIEQGENRLQVSVAESEIAAASVKRMVASVPEEVADRVVFRSVRHSLAELRAAANSVIAANEGVPGIGVDVDERNNIVRVLVASNDASRRVRMQGFSGGPFVEAEAPSGGPTYWKSQYLPSGYVEAGLYLSPMGCTSAFASSSSFGPFLQTAGHCVSQGQAISQGGSPVGNVALLSNPYQANPNNPAFDAALISTLWVRNQWGRIHLNDADWARPINNIMATDSDSIGNTVCESGWARNGQSGYNGGGLECGTIQARFYRPTWIPFGSASYRRVSYVAVGGDSGAGVRWDTVFGVLAAGIQSGCDYVSGTTNCSNGVMSHLPYVHNAWGLTIWT